MLDRLSTDERDALQAIASAAARMNIELMLVGANARRLAFDLPFQLSATRATQDWDFAVHVSSWAAYQKLYDALVMTSSAPFRPGSAPHQLVYQPTRLLIDLLPFGSIATSDDTIQWPTTSQTMSVRGFDDAFESAIREPLPNGTQLRIVKPSMLAVLKLIAFSERGNVTPRDIQDTWHILQRYTDPKPHYDRAFEELVPHFPDNSEHYEHLSPLLLGWDIGRDSRPTTRHAILNILHDLATGQLNIEPLLPSTADTEAREQKRTTILNEFAWLQQGIELAEKNPPAP